MESLYIDYARSVGGVNYLAKVSFTGDFVEVIFIRDCNKNGTWLRANTKLREDNRETSSNWVCLRSQSVFLS